MTKTPIEMMFDGAEWVMLEPQSEEQTDDLLYATHVGKLEIMGTEVICYRLSDGKAIIAPESMAALFGFESVEEFEKQTTEIFQKVGENFDLNEKKVSFKI